MSGFYISRLRLISATEPVAEIRFQPGCNVIAGASDTGKSYIFQCIDYMLGKQEPPKDVPESRKYSKAFLEVKDWAGRTMTFMRPLRGGDALVQEGALEEFSETEGKAELIKATNRPGEKSISSILLGLAGFVPNLQVKKNEKNQKSLLSFRDVVRLITIDEEGMIKERSPVFSGQHISQTREKSVFNLFLTGEDDSVLVAIEGSKEKRNRLKPQIELIKELIIRREEALKNLKPESQDLVENQLDLLRRQFGLIDEKLQSLSRSRKDAWNQAGELEIKIIAAKELLQRFSLLEDHYSSDIERLNFVLDGENGLAQLQEKRCECPVCGADMAELPMSQDPAIRSGIDAELRKIQINLADLQKAKEALEIEVATNKKLFSQRESRFKEIEGEISNKLEPFKKLLKGQLDELLLKQAQIAKYNSLRSQMDELQQKLEQLEDELKARQGPASKGASASRFYREFSKEIAQLLIDWKFIDIDNIRFDESMDFFDIEIDGKARSTHGKGVRAITCSAFAIALMNFCINRGLPHPRFVLLDSPLTSYKDKDRKDLSDSVQKAFFLQLATMEHDRQIIVFENKDPQEEVRGRLHYIHFSGNEALGRAGFFPAGKA